VLIHAERRKGQYLGWRGYQSMPTRVSKPGSLCSLYEELV
jgi:hypothetical protein